MKPMIIFIALCFYSVTSVIARPAAIHLETSPVNNDRLKLYENKRVQGYMCGNELFRSDQIENIRMQACEKLNSLNFFHRYPMKYRPRKDSEPAAIQRIPGQNNYIFPLVTPSKTTKFTRLFHPTEAHAFIVISKSCELKSAIRIKKKSVRKCKQHLCYPWIRKVEEHCEKKVWSVKEK